MYISIGFVFCIYCPLASGTNTFPCLRDIKGFLIVNLVLACHLQVSAFHMYVSKCHSSVLFNFFFLVVTNANNTSLRGLSHKRN